MGELERIDPESVVTRPQMTPDAAREAAQNLRKVIDAVLVEGKHHIKIQGRDVLTKAGAEELLKVFALSFTYHELATSIAEDGTFSASVRCSVQNAGGRTLSESYGLYNSGERRGANPNTVVKMAQKRAFVGAVMAATGTSELFTQDIEEDAPAPPEQLTPSTAEQRLLLAELFARKGGISQREAEAWVREQPYAMTERWVAKNVLVLMLKPDPGHNAATPPGSEEGTPESDPADSDVHGEAPGEPPSDSPDPPEGSGGEPELPPDPPTVEDEEGDDDIPF